MASNILRLVGSAPDQHFQLLALPNELIIEIAHSIDAKDLYHLMQTCHRLNTVLALRLHSCFIQHKDKILLDACIHNTTTLIRRAIAVGARPEVKFLLNACGRNDIEAVIILLDEGKLDVNSCDWRQNVVDCCSWRYEDIYPLQVAVRCGHPIIVEALLSRGIRMNDPDALRGSGVRINRRGGYNYLMGAVDSGDLTVLRLLLKYGATVLAPNGWAYDDALRHAMYNRRDMLLPFIELGYHLEHAIFQPRTALSIAARLDCVGTVKLLLKSGCDANYVQCPWLRTPLSECCAVRGSIETMTALLEAGANPDELDMNSLSSLQIAMSRGHVEAVRLLINWTQHSTHPICWFPKRIRNPEYLEGREECKRILDEAGFNTDEPCLRVRWREYKQMLSDEKEDLQNAEAVEELQEVQEVQEVSVVEEMGVNVEE
ncbi:ankyrin [Morchella conica CCBAS932]|uniref:Ankyrin n=1 Tax=Morchella conica CCBAS932 TaxID=1392247 RepID=A0A3N4KUG3_9PEZI|nr:ankyrin [Morchella conica CCBAS932]